MHCAVVLAGLLVALTNVHATDDPEVLNPCRRGFPGEKHDGLDECEGGHEACSFCVECPEKAGIACFCSRSILPGMENDTCKFTGLGEEMTNPCPDGTECMDMGYESNWDGEVVTAHYCWDGVTGCEMPDTSKKSTKKATKKKATKKKATKKKATKKKAPKKKATKKKATKKKAPKKKASKKAP